MAPWNGSKRTKRVLLGLGAFLVGYLIASYLLRPGPQPKPFDNGGLIAEETSRLIELKNLGLAQLENEQYADCDTVFFQLSDALPRDPLGPRNLLIARLLAARQIDAKRNPDTHAAALRSAEQALEMLRSREGESAVVHLLSAKLGILGSDEQRVSEQLARAVENAPDDPALWYELYDAGRNATDAVFKASSPKAISTAYRLRPDNLYLLIEQLQSQARAKDVTIVQTLKSAGETIKPFVEAVRQRNRVDLHQLIDEAIAGLSGGDEKQWSAVLGKVMILGNLLRPEVATRLDRRRIARHEMEYLLHDFGAEFYDEADLTAAASQPSIEVNFLRAEENGQLPRLGGVQQVCLVDFDLDGRMDLVVAREKIVEVYVRSDDKGGWGLIAEYALDFTPQQLIAADLDRDFRETPPAVASERESSDSNPMAACVDADLDLIVSGAGGIVILKNHWDPDTRRRILEEVPQEHDFKQLSDILAAAVADIDHDGDLDLILSSKGGVSLWSNRDNFTFKEISARSSLPPDDFAATAIIPVDWNRNIDTDILLASPTATSVGYLENIQHGRFRWRVFAAGFEALESSADLALLDVDGNASWDLASAGNSGVALTLTTTRPAETVRYLQGKKVSENATSGLITWDYDNDGYRDLLGWNESTIEIHRGGPNGRFALVEGLLDTPPERIVGCAVDDLDGDGDEDLLVVEPNRLSWYVNEGGNGNHWIDLAIRAESNPQEPSERCNMHGVGSLLELKAGSIYQPRVVTGRSTHFGLGRADRADVARVLWTNGIPHNVIRPSAGSPICEQQKLKGSCPYLYTWTGDRYEFLTDCLWASPIGLQFAEGLLAPAREWEYLKIPGGRLVPFDGEYRLQLTEELWEAAYFDEVRLIAVDHPSDVEIYSNEKVGPAEIAEFRVHTVRQPRLPRSARDKHDRDLLGTIARQDRRFVKTFDGRIKQGLVDEHYLELDLGDLQDSESITLFLTGWIFPTDTSLNVALSQNPSLAGPRPPALWIPDAGGRWREAISYMGFPGGKTKTIAVDLSGLFAARDYRVRIVTSNEIYWDAVFFTVDEDPAEFRLTEIPVAAADLHYRGVSQRIAGNHFAPEWYDYTAVETEPFWPPMLGRFSRYGDVGELLGQTDARLVVLGAGDELTLRFQVPELGPPEGWKRDFLLYNVGWDKDADLNTVYGQTVEPLPFAGMSGYPHDVRESNPDSPRYRDYLKTYQTREQNSRRFWQQVRQYRTEDSLK